MFRLQHGDGIASDSFTVEEKVKKEREHKGYLQKSPAKSSKAIHFDLPNTES